jgi:hypothetical protein
MIMVGGWGDNGGLKDTWLLPLSPLGPWSQEPIVAPVPQFFTHVAALDRARNHLIMFGGYYVRNDSWLLDLEGTPSWSQLMPDGPVLTGNSIRT